MLETILKELDRKNPELVERATAAGMKTLAELEIYPDPNQVVRLPLCRDREMLLNRPLALVKHRRQLVQDVERYVSWLEDPNRQYMTKEQVLDYLHYFSKPGTTSAQKPAGESKAIVGNAWKGNLRNLLPQFWIAGNANGRSLNEHIAVLIRLAACYGHTESRIVTAIKTFVAELPECAKPCSSRLTVFHFVSLAELVKLILQIDSQVRS